eukprot:284816034_5
MHAARPLVPYVHAARPSIILHQMIFDFIAFRKATPSLAVVTLDPFRAFGHAAGYSDNFSYSHFRHQVPSKRRNTGPAFRFCFRVRPSCCFICLCRSRTVDFLGLRPQANNLRWFLCCVGTFYVLSLGLQIFLLATFVTCSRGLHIKSSHHRIADRCPKVSECLCIFGEERVWLIGRNRGYRTQQDNRTKCTHFTHHLSLCQPVSNVSGNIKNSGCSGGKFVGEYRRQLLGTLHVSCPSPLVIYRKQ